MRPGGGDDADTEARRQSGQRGVAFVVERVTMMGQLDADPAGVNRSTRSASARCAAAGPPWESAWRTWPLRQPVRMCQCPPAASVSASKS